MQSSNEDHALIGGIDKIKLLDEPIVENSSFEFSVGMEKRSLSGSEDERKDGVVSDEDRKSPETTLNPSDKSTASVTLASSAVVSTRSVPVVSPDRQSLMEEPLWKSEPCVLNGVYDDEVDDMSLASGYSYDTTATSESVQDIISRLQSETDRRRRRLMRRRSRRIKGANGSDRLQKYNSGSFNPTDPKLGITVEIKE